VSNLTPILYEATEKACSSKAREKENEGMNRRKRIKANL
jgi:hypothetical protein